MSLPKTIKVLYLSYDGMTDPLGQSQVLPYLAGLAASGHEITLISFEKGIRYQVSGISLGKEIEAFGIFWYPLTYTKWPPVLSTVWDIMKLIRFASKLQKKEQFQVVHCRSYITAFVGHYLQRKFDAKFIFDMRGFWADERVEGKLWNTKNPLFNLIYKYFKHKEKQWLRDAGHVVCLTESAKKIIAEWGRSKNVSVIPCCVDTHLFDPQIVDVETVKAVRKNLDIHENQMVLGYLGSVGTWYLLDEMLLFFKSLKQIHPNSVFVFMTAEDPIYIIKRAEHFGVNADSLRIKEIKRVELSNYLKILTFALCFVKPGFSKQASSPTKLGELMSMGIPVVCNPGVGDIDMLLTKYQSGYLLPDFSENEIQKAIGSIHTFSHERIRTAAIDFYSLEKGVKAYAKVYFSVERRI